MSDYFLAMAAGLGHVFSFPGILIPVLGTLIAMTTAFLPGIGSAGLSILLLLWTVHWDPVSVLLLFGALTGGATFMGSITAILFNIPGTSSAAAAMLDGHPMARAGLPKTAIACAATASAIGSVIGVLALIAILPVIRPVLLEFGPLERLLLGLWGLATIAAVPGSRPSRVLAAAALGLAAALVGSDPITGAARLTFGNLELLDGLGVLTVLIGFFTLAELIGWRRTIDLPLPPEAGGKDSVRAGIGAVLRHPGLVARSSLTGTVIGSLPGVGGTVAAFVAYGQALQAGRRTGGTFGQGDIRGLIAPEAAADSKDGGSLLPVLAFGLPGSEGGVILLTVLAVHGLVPGEPMLGDGLSLTFTLIFALLMSNLLTSVIGVALAPSLARLTRLRIERLALPIIVASLVSLVQINGLLIDLTVAVGMGVLGYLFLRCDWPRIPFIVAFVLGGFIEHNWTLTAQLVALDRIVITERPAALVIAGMILVSVLLALRPRRQQAAGPRTLVPAQPADAGRRAGWLGLGLAGVVLLAFGESLVSGRPLSGYAVTVLGAALVLCSWTAWPLWTARTIPGRSAPTIPPEHRLPLALLLALPLAVPLVGLAPSMGLFTLFWLGIGREGGARPWAFAGLAAAAAAGASWVFLDRIAVVLLPQPLLWPF